MRACLDDVNTAHTPEQLSESNKPRQFEWERNCTNTSFNLFAFTSDPSGWRWCVLIQAVYCVFLTLEPPSIQPHIYQEVQKSLMRFDTVLSLADPNVLPGPNVVQWSYGSSWVPIEEWVMPIKHRVCSIIASSKNVTAGHWMRHRVIKYLKSVNFPCDVLGRGYSPVKAKADGLRPYMFSIVIENSKSGRYMTEKIMDALACGTVPVYWGSDYAAKVFPGAIIPFETLQELAALLPGLNERKYASMRPMVEQAQSSAKRFVPPEQWIWDNLLHCTVKAHCPELCS